MVLKKGLHLGRRNSCSIPGTTQWTYFAALAGTGAVFLLLAFFVFLPVIILVPSKFAITFSMGSALVLSSLGALRGWKALAISMISKERTPFTAAYVVSLAATLYSSLVMHSYIFSLVCCAGQIVTLVYFIASFFPGGAAGAQYVLGTLGQGSLAMGGAIFRSIFSR